MASLKDLRTRISSVKSTKKITSAMKMVAAAKLKKAQENAVAARPYSERMRKILTSLKINLNEDTSQTRSLINIDDQNEKVLLLVCSADRGLCGGFNGSIIRYTKKLAQDIINNGKCVKFIFIGNKASNALKRNFRNHTLDIFTDIANPTINFDTVSKIRDKIIEYFNNGEFDRCELVYTKFNTAISQEVKKTQLIPLEQNTEITNENPDTKIDILYEFEPSQKEILEKIIPQNIAFQIFSALLESAASEHGARMTAMDNATRNADDKIDDLTMFYNRSRQAVITKELIEIISGAEAI